MRENFSQPTVNLDELILLTTQLMSKQNHEPTENPVLILAQKIKQYLKSGALSFDELTEITQRLRDSAFLSHARYLQNYVGMPSEKNIVNRFDQVLKKIIKKSQNLENNVDAPCFETFKKLIEKSQFAAVFTAHPTFALANSVYSALANLASHPIDNETKLPFFATHRRASPPTLQEELNLATSAISRARNSIDRFNRHLFEYAKATWPHRWIELVPCSILLSSWVGYDTDGRTDISWWDSLRIRLHMKELQLQRLYDQLSFIPHQDISEFKNKVALAITMVQRQIKICPTFPDPEQFSDFAKVLIEEREHSIHSPNQLLPLFDHAFEVVQEKYKIDLLIAKVGFFSHGLSLSHTHVRLNSVQIHNMARQRLGIINNLDSPSHTRTLFNVINSALENVKTIPVDFGAILSEKASASVLMMLLTQITKHIDSKTPIRFLIAETESGYTLLIALWLAKLFGIENQVEISALFESDKALQHGSQIMEQAFRSEHWCDYLRKTGKLCVQFGYSDSGRFIGQIASTYQIEKLRHKIILLLRKYDLNSIELVFFDTHGESIGRGAHPFRLEDRLSYLSPFKTDQCVDNLDISIRRESSFQGGDGYLLYGSQALADATISIIAKHIFNPEDETNDPIYYESDFCADFFSTIAAKMKELVNDKGYGTVLSAFGPGLIDKTGSRPAIRQNDTTSVTTRIKHPKELRAIPNNAILQQLGWCANILQGLGAAASANPEIFQEMSQTSPRFKKSLDFAWHALKHSNPLVLRAMIYLLDPGIWLNRASTESDPDLQESYIALAKGLQRMEFWSSTQAMFHRIHSDHITLLSIWKEAPQMDTNEILLHAIRLALIEEIWILSTEIPYFSPYHDFSREVLETKILCLEIPTALELLSHVFPQAPDYDSDLYFHETKGPRHEGAYARDDRRIFKPIQKNFDLIREISVALIHRLHAFG
ncbi:Phosphoenolpyruvate carboxylase [Commensalibacter sp. Nvir]|uniref:phosphoenolpyruvate carboxylase n=1 Tax=Commensalibacter sp. Nvir TaxID=3069817 RepID=UPI002D37954F|nr:Phosphoenolpyruvate carboxylase [Commensalibacter sp. Nvir]